MFRVANLKTGQEFVVYKVDNTEEGEIYFLIFNDKWTWVSPYDYVPIEPVNDIG